MKIFKGSTSVFTEGSNSVAFDNEHAHRFIGQDEKTLGEQSAAMGLFHEMGHWYRRNFNNISIPMSDAKARIAEENYVTQFIEGPAARKLGEFIRTSYHPDAVKRLEYYKPISVTSTEEKKQ